MAQEAIPRTVEAFEGGSVVIHWLRPNENGAAACGAGDLVDLDRDPNFVTCPACIKLAEESSTFTHWLVPTDIFTGACGFGIATRRRGDPVAISGDVRIVDCPACRRRIETLDAIERGEELPS